MAGGPRLVPARAIWRTPCELAASCRWPRRPLSRRLLGQCGSAEVHVAAQDRDGDRRYSASWVARLGTLRMAVLVLYAEQAVATHDDVLRRTVGTGVRGADCLRGGGEPVSVEGPILNLRGGSEAPRLSDYLGG